MARKKKDSVSCRARVCLSFNLDDPYERVVFHVLRNHPRKVTQIVKNAILYGKRPDDQELKDAVSHILATMGQGTVSLSDVLSTQQMNSGVQNKTVANTVVTPPAVPVVSASVTKSGSSNQFHDSEGLVEDAEFDDGIMDDALDDALDAFGDI